MKRTSILGAALALPLSVSAVTFEIDFNDVQSGGGTDPILRDAAVDGGVAKDGGAFTSGYDANTGLVRLIAGDLTATAAGYSISQGAVTGDGPWSVAFFDPPSHRALSRYQHRDIEDFATGTTWISFIVNLNADYESDGTEGPCFAGLLLGNGLNASAQSDPDPLTGAGYLGFTYIPPGLPGEGSYLEYSPGEIDFTDLSSGGAGTVRGALSGDLGLAPGTSYLLIAKLDAGANTISAWIDPADVTSEAALGAPQLSATLDLPNITALGHGGFADNTGPADGKDVQCLTDAIRISNEPNGLARVTTTPDPLLAQSPAGGQFGDNPDISGDLDFPITVGSAPVTRTIQFVNNGPNNDIEITSLDIMNDAGGVFAITAVRDFFGDPVTFPLTMIPTDTLDIEVTFDPAASSGTFTAELAVDTNQDSPSNQQDKLVSISATNFAPGQKLNPDNFNFEADPYNLNWKTQLVSQGGGVAPGSSQSARLDQGGDGYLITNDFPALSDFTITFYFAAPDIPGAQTGDSNILFALRGPPFDRIATLAYFPAGVDIDPTPGWYQFTTFWNRVAGLGTIAGSVDGNDNNSLDDAGDTKNVYRVTITGRGFGDFGAEYDIAVTGIDGAAGGGSVAGLFDFEQLSPSGSGPTSFAFEQRDGQLPSAVATGLANQAAPWIDDFCILAGTTLPDPDLQVADVPTYGQLINVGAPVSDTLVLRNEGSSPLSVTNIVSSDSHFVLTPAPTFPVVIPGGGVQSFDVQFDAGGDSGVFSGELTVTSDDSVTPTEVVGVHASSFSDGDKLITPNFDFEDIPFDNLWTNSGGVVAETGVAPMTGTIAYVAGGHSLGRDFVGTPDFEVQYFLALDDSPDRQLNFYISNDPVEGANDGTPALNLRYQASAGEWSVYDGSAWQQLGQLGSVTPAAGAVNVYLLKIVGRGWGSPGATYDLFLSDLGGTEFTSAVTDLSFTHGGSLADGTPTGLRFRADTGNNPGFWIDDVCVTVGAPAVDDPNLEVLATPEFPTQLDDNSALTSELVLGNSGLNNTLTITDVLLGGGDSDNFAILTPFPIDILPGQQASVMVQFERGADSAGIFQAVATIVSNDETTQLFDIPIQGISLEDSGKIIENIDFEDTSGAPFASWNTVKNVIAVADGLVEGSTTSALVGLDSVMSQDFTVSEGVGNFSIDLYFAYLAGSNRQFNMVLRDADPANPAQVNFRYNEAAPNFQCFNGTAGQGGAWQTAIDMAATPLMPSEDTDMDGSLGGATDVTNVYRLRFTALAWGTENPTFNVELFHADDTPIASATGLALFQNALPTTAGGGQIEFTTDFGGNGFWVDEVCVSSLETLPPAEPLVLTAVRRAGDDVVLEWNDLGVSGFTIQRSGDGENFTTIATGIAGTTYTDIGVLSGGSSTALYRIILP